MGSILISYNSCNMPSNPQCGTGPLLLAMVLTSIMFSSACTAPALDTSGRQEVLNYLGKFQRDGSALSPEYLEPFEKDAWFEAFLTLTPDELEQARIGQTFLEVTGGLVSNAEIRQKAEPHLKSIGSPHVKALFALALWKLDSSTVAEEFVIEYMKTKEGKRVFQDIYGPRWEEQIMMPAPALEREKDPIEVSTVSDVVTKIDSNTTDVIFLESSDEMLAALAEYGPNVTKLAMCSNDLISTDVSGVGIGYLGRLPYIEHLTLSSSGWKENDQWLAQLQKLPSLKCVEIDCGIWGDSVLMYLAGIKGIRIVRLENVGGPFSDAALENIPLGSQLEELRIWCHNFTDEGYQHLVKLENLVDLDVWLAKNMTDQSLVHFSKMKKLRRLTLRHAVRISDDGLRKLRAACPDLKVILDPQYRR